MHCQDFATDDLGWFVALGYWFVNGRPSRLDADGDGLPCEHMPFPITHEDGSRGKIIWGDELWIDLYRPGMYCRDLATEEEYPPYWVAVLYWLAEGEPPRMDADGDGIPCETIYPEEFIRGFLENPSLIRHDDPKIDDLEPGMRCRDLRWWMAFYEQALGYYFSEGLPARMDADGDGIPCETVYEEAETFGDWERQNMPSDLTCADLAEETTYWGVIRYYLAHDRPTQLDPDSDGYPCSPGWSDQNEVEYFKDGSPNCCAG